MSPTITIGSCCRLGQTFLCTHGWEKKLGACRVCCRVCWQSCATIIPSFKCAPNIGHIVEYCQMSLYAETNSAMNVLYAAHAGHTRTYKMSDNVIFLPCSKLEGEEEVEEEGEEEEEEEEAPHRSSSPSSPPSSPSCSSYPSSYASPRRRGYAYRVQFEEVQRQH